MKKPYLISDVIVFLVVILFIYASFSKLSIVEQFQEQMKQSPLLPPSIIPALAYFVPLFELLIVVLFFFDKTKIIGLYLSFFTMLSFTIYLTMLLTIDENVPCSCGGILGKMSFRFHIVFNCCFTLLTLIAIFLEDKRKKLHA